MTDKKELRELEAPFSSKREVAKSNLRTGSPRENLVEKVGFQKNDWSCEECGCDYKWFIEVSEKEAKKLLRKEEFEGMKNFYNSQFGESDDDIPWLLNPQLKRDKKPELYASVDGIEWGRADDGDDYCAECKTKMYLQNAVALDDLCLIDVEGEEIVEKALAQVRQEERERVINDAIEKGESAMINGVHREVVRVSELKKLKETNHES